jgi:hypothetical protein
VEGTMVKPKASAWEEGAGLSERSAVGRFASGESPESSRVRLVDIMSYIVSFSLCVSLFFRILVKI